VELAGFAIGRFEVTLSQFNEYLRAHGQKLLTGRPNLPVVGVAWDQAASYCNWLQELTGRRFRLPTEAEWEYSCRAGRTSQLDFADDPSALSKYAWYFREGVTMPNEVGILMPNGFGLFDMQGNAAEWCANSDADSVDVDATGSPLGWDNP